MLILARTRPGLHLVKSVSVPTKASRRCSLPAFFDALFPPFLLPLQGSSGGLEEAVLASPAPAPSAAGPSGGGRGLSAVTTPAPKEFLQAKAQSPPRDAGGWQERQYCAAPSLYWGGYDQLGAPPPPGCGNESLGQASTPSRWWVM
jgi:hypothetical protein